MTPLVFAVIVLSIPASLLAQSSATYRLSEPIFNAGGRPAHAVVASSAGYRISLDSIGEGVARSALSGPSLRLDAGFVTAYAPPGEVTGLLVLSDGETLTWSRDPASTAYNVYSGPLATLPGDYGPCAVSRVEEPTWVDPSLPDPGTGVFFLVTGSNSLRQEGTKGQASSGVERLNDSPCP
jgi:hypothetical protein